MGTAEGAHFHGATTATTPNGSLLITRFKASVSVSVCGNSFKLSLAISIKCRALPRVPVISPGVWEIGRPIWSVISSARTSFIFSNSVYETLISVYSGRARRRTHHPFLCDRQTIIQGYLAPPFVSPDGLGDDVVQLIIRQQGPCEDGLLVDWRDGCLYLGHFRGGCGG